MVFRACVLLLGRGTDDERMVALAPPHHVSSFSFLQGRAKFIYASRYGPQVDAGRLTTMRQGEPPCCHHLLQG
jgi:hypothetical protein